MSMYSEEAYSETGELEAFPVEGLGASYRSP